MLNFKQIYEDILAEDAMISAPTTSGAGEVVQSQGTSAGDVLGNNCDHEHDGYLSTKCFHVPSRCGKLMKRIDPKKKKNPYCQNSTLTVLNDAELNRSMLNSLHMMKEDDISHFIFDTYKKLPTEIESIAYFPKTKSLFIRFSAAINATTHTNHYYVNVDFDGSKFIPISKDIMTKNQIIREYMSMNDDPTKNLNLAQWKIWVVWGGV